jgi:hypothetical protein
MNMFAGLTGARNRRRAQILAMRDRVLAQYTGTEREAYRAGGDVVCPVCGFVYYDHPKDGPPDHNGEKYLNRLCNGNLVKL